MGKYAQRLGGLFRKDGITQQINGRSVLLGNRTRQKNFAIWWKRISRHALIFGSLALFHHASHVAFVTTAGLDGS